MKKLLSVALMCLCSLVLYAQKDVTTFLGIPVDGTKAEMIEKLKAKGFTSHPYDEDALRGEFNGEDVRISVVTNNNKVYRVAVFDENTRDEAQIRIRFNTLCRQFQNNGRYVSGSGQTIPKDENITLGILTNKQYEAVYYQWTISEMKDMVSRMDTATIAKELMSFSEKFEKKYTEKGWDNITEEEMANDIKEIDFVQSMMKVLVKKCVWFKIDKALSYGQFRIVMFYDNEYNRASGEDL